MKHDYSDELRGDSASIIIPFISLLVILYALISMALTTARELANLWYLLVLLILSPFVAQRAMLFIKNQKAQVGAKLFVGAHLLLLTLLLSQVEAAGTAQVLPYFFAILIIAASMLISPVSSLFAWAVSAVLILLGTVVTKEFTFSTFINLLVPISFNLIVAIALYLSAMEWQFAVESVSHLHRRAQNRRDELFAMKEEVTKANDRLVFLNRELDKSRREALHERDIRTRFMNNVSHELRTPLNAIVNFAHILERESIGPVNQTQADYLARIERSGWHLLNILNDLLDMAQIESGEFKLYLEASDLRDVCEEAAIAVQGLLLDKEHVAFYTEYPERWPQLRIDRMRMKQGLINLLGNAAKYTEEGHITLSVSADDAFAYIQVSDTGVGIAPKYHDLIFQEFKQVDETAARKRIGTGLGLPITRHLVERHGGSISLESDLGQGATFTIKLPLHHPEEEELEREPVGNKNGRAPIPA